MTSPPTVGFIGLGVMGAAMAGNLLQGGCRLRVNDIDRAAATALIEAGAVWADTPREVAEGADVVFSCLPDLAAIEAVALGPQGVLAGIRPGGVYFETSTNAPDLARRIHDAFAEAGAHMLEAPISGGATGARRGRLAIWAGGDRAAFDRFEPVLRMMSDRPLHVGPIGAGLVTKLVHNCTSQAVQAAIAEVFVLGVKAGAEPLALWEAVRQGALGRRRTFDGLVDQFLPGRYDETHAALRIIDKDLTLAAELAERVGAPTPIADLARADIRAAMARGWAERDCRSVMLLPQERAGVSIAVDPADIRAVLERDPPAPTDTKHGQGA
jgi:3-hydroxyisobutyrate dehydrogenase-like beta-hydroxyacid dehydrogenase